MHMPFCMLHLHLVSRYILHQTDQYTFLAQGHACLHFWNIFYLKDLKSYYILYIISYLNVSCNNQINNKREYFTAFEVLIMYSYHCFKVHTLAGHTVKPT